MSNRGFFDNTKFRTTSRYTEEMVQQSLDGQIINNSKSIGYIESILANNANGAYATDRDGTQAINYMSKLLDTTTRDSKPILFHTGEQSHRIRQIRELMNDSRILRLLETITNDSITPDEHGRFCVPIDIKSKFMQKSSIIESYKDMKIDADKLQQEYLDAYHIVMEAWGFDFGNRGHELFMEFLRDGILAFEIIYNSDKTQIIGFKQIDPSTVDVKTRMDGDRAVTYWEQTIGNQTATFNDSDIIFLQYQTSMFDKRISYAERFLRDMNMIRNYEQTLLMWTLFYGMPHVKTEVPVGNKPFYQQKQELDLFAATTKEDIDFNNDTGSLGFGKSEKQPYVKNYYIPVPSTGNKISMELMQFKGIDFQNDTFLNHHWDNIKIASMIPFSQLDYKSGGGSYSMGPDSVPMEQIAYGRFRKQLQNAFSTIITKSIHIQMCLNNRMLSGNQQLKNLIGVKFNSTDVFERRLDMEMAKYGAEAIKILSEMQKNEGGFLEQELLVKKFWPITPEDLIENEQIKKGRMGGGKAQNAEAIAEKETGGGSSSSGGGDRGSQSQPATAQEPAAKEGGESTESEPTEDEVGNG